MTFALVVDNAIVEERNRLPSAARRQDTGEWVLDLPNAHWSRQRATGWWTVTATTRPVDTATDTYDRSLVLVDGAPVETWTIRPWTPEELAARLAQANRSTVDSRLVTVDLPAMQAIIDQTNADLRTDPSQEIKDIARAVRRLTRIVEGVLDGVD